MKGFRHYVKLLVYFGEDGTKSIISAKTKGLKAIYISFSALSFAFSSVTQVITLVAKLALICLEKHWLRNY